MPEEGGDERKNNGGKGKVVRNNGGNRSVIVVDDSASVRLSSTAVATGEKAVPTVVASWTRCWRRYKGRDVAYPQLFLSLLPRGSPITRVC